MALPALREARAAAAATNAPGTPATGPARASASTKGSSQLLNATPPAAPSPAAPDAAKPKTEAELVDGKCPDHRTVPQWIEEQNYFFRMGKYQERLLAELEARPDLIRPERYRNEVLAMLRGAGIRAHLDERDAQVLLRRSGAVREVETLEAIGETFELSRERVRQIEKRGLDRLHLFLIAGVLPIVAVVRQRHVPLQGLAVAGARRLDVVVDDRRDHVADPEA